MGDANRMSKCEKKNKGTKATGRLLGSSLWRVANVLNLLTSHGFWDRENGAAMVVINHQFSFPTEET